MRTHGEFTCRVAGLTFRPGYPHTVQAIEPDDVLRLERDRDNEFDANAVRVLVPSLGAGAFIGFLPRNAAGMVAPKMDDGVFVEAELVEVVVSPENPNQPGVEIRVSW